MLRPFAADRMRAYPVNLWVNDARHDDARCLEPAACEGLCGRRRGEGGAGRIRNIGVGRVPFLAYYGCDMS
jgi:hypothetical protein